MAHPLRHMAAGAQTLRFVAAVVCSVGVTSAVAGPMAWQAVEYHRDQADAAVVEVEATPSEVGVSARASTLPPARTVPSSEPTVAPEPSTTVATTTTTAPTTTPPAIVSSTPPSPSSVPATSPPPVATTGPSDALVPAVPPPTTVAPVVPSPVPIPAAETPPSTEPPAAATTRPGGLDEFDPRAACEDKAHELGVEVPPDCPNRPG